MSNLWDNLFQKADVQLQREILDFYQNQGFDANVRKVCASFIEDEEMWRKIADMCPYENSLYDKMIECVKNDAILMHSINSIKERYSINEQLASVMSSCLQYERMVLDRLSEGLLPDKAIIEEVIRECSLKTEALKRKLQEFVMLGPAQVDLNNLSKLITQGEDEKDEDSAVYVYSQLIRGLNVWKRLQQLLFIMDKKQEELPKLNSLQKEFESFASFLLQFKTFVDLISNVDLKDLLMAHLTTIVKELVTRSLLFELQPPQNIKLQSGPKKTKDFEFIVRFLVGKTLLKGEKPMVTASFDCEHNLGSSDSKHQHGYNVYHNELPLESGIGRNEWSCCAHLTGVKAISFKRCTGEKKTEEVSEQKYGIRVKVTIPNDGFGNSYPLEIVSLPIIITTQTSQDWGASATILWDNAFAKPDRQPYKVKDRVPWSRLALILSERFRATVGRGLTKDHLNYLKSKILPPGSGANEEVSWSRFNKERMHGVDFTFWRWLYAVHNLTRNHLKRAWGQGLVEGFISKEDSKRKLRDPSVSSRTFMLRFSDSTIDDNQSSNFCGGLVVTYVANKDQQDIRPDVNFVKPFMSTDLTKTRLCSILLNLEVETRNSLTEYPPKYYKTALDYLYPNQPFLAAFGTLIAEEQAEVEKELGKEKADSDYRPWKIKMEVMSEGDQYRTKSNPPLSSAASPAYQQSESSYHTGIEDPFSPASTSFMSSIGSPQSIYPNVGSPEQTMLLPQVVCDQNVTVEPVNQIDFNLDDLTLNNLNSQGDSGGSSSEIFRRFLESPDVEMAEQTVGGNDMDPVPFIPPGCQ